MHEFLHELVDAVTERLGVPAHWERSDATDAVQVQRGRLAGVEITRLHKAEVTRIGDQLLDPAERVAMLGDEGQRPAKQFVAVFD
jgi:hypothetical protein